MAKLNIFECNNTKMLCRSNLFTTNNVHSLLPHLAVPLPTRLTAAHLPPGGRHWVPCKLDTAFLYFYVFDKEKPCEQARTVFYSP